MHRHFRLAGVVLAAIAWIATLILPMYSPAAQTATPDGSGTTTEVTATLIEVNGWWAVLPGLLLVLLAVGVWRAPQMMVRWICLALFLLLTALSMASIGLFFLPAALFLILGVAMDLGDTRD
ncbi:MAG: hypothetical protein GX344_09485 [Intrasporangiaceae bacterium]|mgnify:CR=1 FL=1|nr:hypothetical protein [Intrasporangiaceae bacterium]